MASKMGKRSRGDNAEQQAEQQVTQKEIPEMVNVEGVRSCFAKMTNALRGREIGLSIRDGAIPAVVLVTFLKYTSDRRDELGLKMSDLYRFDALCELFPKVIGFRQLREHLQDIELHLGLSRFLLHEVILEARGANGEEQFRRALEAARGLDFTSSDAASETVQALLETIDQMAKTSKSLLGPVVTNLGVAKLMSSLLMVHDGDDVYAPFVGLGLAVGSAVNGKDVTVFARDTIATCAAVTLLILIMSGVQRGEVDCGDVFDSAHGRIHERLYDKVICDPPPFPTWEPRGNIHLLYPEEPLNDPWLPVRHILASLKPGGRAAVLLPMGLMTRYGKPAAMRARLIEDGYIEAVVELPGGVAYGSGYKSTLLMLSNPGTTQSISGRIFFCDLTSHSWGGGEKAEERIAQRIIARETIPGKTAFASREEMARNDYQLACARYVAAEVDKDQYLTDLGRLYEKARDLQDRYEALNKTVDDITDEYFLRALSPRKNARGGKARDAAKATKTTKAMKKEEENDVRR